MQVVRVYTGPDGESHLEDLELPYERIAQAERTAMEGATGIQFRRAISRTFTSPRGASTSSPCRGRRRSAWATAPNGFSTRATCCWPMI